MSRPLSRARSLRPPWSIRTTRLELRASSTPGPTAQPGQQAAEVLERLQVVGGEKVIDMRQRRRHAACQRLVSLRAQEGVEPDQSVGRTPEVDELGREPCRISSVPSIADDDHHRAVSQHAPGPMAVEIGQRLADAGASTEIVDALAHGLEAAIEVSIAKQSSDPRKSRREYEGFHILPARDSVREDHQQPRVALHRTAHVADQHQRPSAYPRPAVEQAHQLAARPDRMACGAPKIDPSRPRRAKAPRLALGDSPPPLLHHSPPPPPPLPAP